MAPTRVQVPQVFEDHIVPFSGQKCHFSNLCNSLDSASRSAHNKIRAIVQKIKSLKLWEAGGFSEQEWIEGNARILDIVRSMDGLISTKKRHVQQIYSSWGVAGLYLLAGRNVSLAECLEMIENVNETGTKMESGNLLQDLTLLAKRIDKATADILAEQFLVKLN